MKKSSILRQLVLIGSLLGVQTLFAQAYKDYDISKYYTPDIVRNSLDLNFNSSGNYTGSEFTNTNINLVYMEDTTSLANLSGHLNSSFKRYINTRKRISSLVLTGDISGNHTSNREQSKLTSTSGTNQGYVSINYSDIFYNTSNLFLSIGFAGGLYTNNVYDNKNLITLPEHRYHNSFNYQILPTISIGKGRIESVRDARQAIYILDDLSKQGVLTRHLSDEEIFNLAQTISRVKNKRFLDARLHLIDEITAIDSFFVKNHFIKDANAKYMTSLYDNWLYGDAFERLSGQTFTLTFSPSISNRNGKDKDVLSYIDSTSLSTSLSNNSGGRISFIYNYEKPFKQNWQHSIYASITDFLGYNLFKESIGTEDLEYHYQSNNIILSGKYILGYYPNSRTNLKVGIYQLFSEDFQHSSGTNVLEPQNQAFSTSTSILLSAYYYLSRQLRISGTASIENQYYLNNYNTYNDNNKILFANFSATLLYSFF